MQKRRILLPLAFGLMVVTMASCSKTSETVTVTSNVPVTNTVTQTVTVTREPEIDYTYKDEMTYESKELNVYRKKGVVDKKFPVRFYSETPNIPYVNIEDFYEEFFGKEYSLTKDNYMYTYQYNGECFMKYDIKNDIFYGMGLDAFSQSSLFITSTVKTFLTTVDKTISPKTERIVDLKKYNIDIHGDKDLYVPLTFISTLSGGAKLYNIAYNTKDLYVLDYDNVLNNKTTDPNTGKEIPEAHTMAYFGTDYTDPIYDTTKERPDDLIAYNYGQICFDFDVLRGYTSQMLFGDNALISLGLDGLLETYYPKIKEYLLSENKTDYAFGYLLLFIGLYDGGHTTPAIKTEVGTHSTDELDQNYKDLVTKYAKKTATKTLGQYAKQTKETMGFNASADTGFYYKYDATTKTALVGFDTFKVDYDAWDKFFKDNKTAAEAPVTTDTYAYIRSCFYQAKIDGAENLVLDLSSNGGGDSGALLGIVGLINKGKATLSINNTFDKNRTTDNCLIDVNLDGKCDDADITEANKFNFNYAVITTPIAFSCGNLLPSELKELGVKIVGQRSGGGSCAISISTTPDGLVFVRSNEHNLSNAAGENIDSGVPLDYEIAISDANDQLDLTGLYTFDFKAYFEQVNQQS